MATIELYKSKINNMSNYITKLSLLLETSAWICLP